MAEETQQRMKWSDEHDINLLREILSFEPFSHKHGSEERGKCWERIAESLNKFQDDELFYKVSQRSVRDRYNYLEKKFKEKVRAEEQATGICPEEESEIHRAIRDIMERFRETQQLPIAKNYQKDLAQGKEMRQQSLETFRETLKRNSDDEPQPPKRRNTGTETFRFLKEKADSDKEIKQMEINFKREELKEKSRIEEMVNEREREKIRLQQTQVEQQQQLNVAFFQGMQQQQQQQQQLMVALFEVLKNKNN